MNRCFPCFGDAMHTDNEREPLLPQHRAPVERLSETPVTAERPVVDKIVDVLAALNAGKLPTQDQFSHFLRIILNSELLKEDTGRVISSHGPMSKEGRKALGDIRGLVQAFLKFGLEKNADDKFQELYFQVAQTENELTERRISTATHAAQRAVEETSEGAGHFKEFTSIQSQVTLDAATLIHAIRTLCETSLKSPDFRLLLADILSIAKDVIAHAVADVAQAAGQVQEAVTDIQQQVETTDDIIGRVADASVDDAKNKGKEAADNITDAAKRATHDLGNELDELAEQAEDIAKEKLLYRTRQIFARLQKDSASRGAVRAILLLSRKYTEVIANAAKRSEDTVIDIAAQVKQDDAPNYPPQPYSVPKAKVPFFDATSDALLQNIKDVLQRLAQGHSLDKFISAFGCVVRDLDTVAIIVEEEVEKNLEEEAPQSPTTSEAPSPTEISQQPSSAPPKAKGKGKRHKKARMRELKKAREKQAKLSPATSSSQLTTTSREETPVRQSRQNENALRAFFPRLGAYLDKALDEPDWVMSKNGANTLEGLFDDGYELFNALDEAVVEIGKKVVAEGEAPTGMSASEKSQRQIKSDLEQLVNEAEVFIAAMRNDKTTMSILHALDLLGDDLSSLFMQGAKQGRRGNFGGIGSWTSWVGWAIPRLLRMLPSNVVPIPTVEVKTETIEGAVHALFIQGLARGSADPITASLIPDEVVLKEWTEVRIDMAEQPYDAHEPSSIGSKSGVQSTSRVRMHMDGVRAKVEGMGYYFKYTGGLIGYEDEGILSVDVGMGRLHDGLSVDVEIEIASENTPFEQIPQIIIVDEDSEAETEAAVVTNSNLSTSGAADQPPAEPLFRVVDVHVAMSDVKCRIDKSKHWILNKLFLEHLAGPVVARMAKQVLEERLRAGLDILSNGLGVVLRDAREKGELRRSKQREGSEEGVTEILGDWLNAILSTGPLLFGRSQTGESNESNTRIDVEHRMKNTATSRGVIHTTTTTTTEQPRGTPAMVYNFVTNNLEEVNLPVQDIGGAAKVQEEETVVAIGNGPQLFPGKGGAYSATDHSDERGVIKRVQDAAQDVANVVVDGLHEGTEQVTRVEERWQQNLDTERQSMQTWKSGAFDF